MNSLPLTATINIKSHGNDSSNVRADAAAAKQMLEMRQ
ncbi:hypothetical protein L917_12113 [Phytophthora nicotianae]|uniref:Uncharacterized protein n=1 Tax=Phytophthora nicotianae TaxID=4792 RepID=W2KWV8_PHYNI|nr:hypothetical protein L916_12273 [Phytophthora nicotianae]ETL88860.1 hypothetical protein L917_12113 [Phytophthora nicotianae]